MIIMKDIDRSNVLGPYAVLNPVFFIYWLLVSISPDTEDLPVGYAAIPKS